MYQFLLDIETRRTNNAELIRRISAKVAPPKTHKKAETIQKWWAEEGEAARTAAIEETALDGTYGMVASIAWTDTEGVLHVTRDHDERSMLALIHEVFVELEGKFGQIRDIVAFNGEFDLRFLYQRMVINGFKVPNLLRAALKKKDGFIDPMKDWAGYRGYISQSDLAAAMGIENPDKTTGADMAALIDAGDWEAVEFHNVNDVKILQDIFRRMYA